MKRLFIFLFAVFFINLTYSQENIVEKVRNEIEVWGEAKILIPKDNIKDLNILAKTISLDYPQGDFWLGYVNQKQYDNFLLLDLKHKIFEGDNPIKALTMATTMSQMNNWDRYPTYQVYDSLMRRFALSYPSICKLDTIGFSVNNRLILALKISSNPYQEIDKPKFCYSSTMHGDELAGYVLLLRLSNWLLSNYGINQRATDIINNTQIFINPLANPDGTYAGGNSTVGYSKRYNANNIDLNRNFPDPIAGQHSDSEQWQKETLAFMNYADSNEFSISANLHSGAEVLNYPYDCATSSNISHADVDWFIDVCENFVDSIPSYAPAAFFTDVASSGYINGGNWYVVYGGRQDYHTYFKHSREITFEVSLQKKLSTSELTNYWNYLSSGLITYIENCQKGLEGYIRDSITNQPLRAKVWVETHDGFNSEIYSKTSSGYYYRPILDGTYTISFFCDGYFPKTMPNITISGTGLTIQNVLLARDENSLEKINNRIEYNVYPNPANDFLTISLNSKPNIKTNYSITNSLGVKLLEGDVIDKKTIIDISNLKRGIFFINVGTKVTKFIKE